MNFIEFNEEKFIACKEINDFKENFYNYRYDCFLPVETDDPKLNSFKVYNINKGKKLPLFILFKIELINLKTINYSRYYFDIKEIYFANFIFKNEDLNRNYNHLYLYESLFLECVFLKLNKDLLYKLK